MTKAILIALLGLLAACTAVPAYFPQIDDLDRNDRRDYLQYLQALQTPQEVPATVFSTDGQGLGQVSSVGVDSNGDLFVFHRADRPWTAETFEDFKDTLSENFKSPIQKETIYKLNPVTGKVITKLGANFFNVPHGMNFDANDSLWLTDVGRHQVFRMPKGASTPDLILGEQFVPGNDETHFCKPTDVVVASNGQFFVTDGYCNSRVLKFDENGKFLAQWGTQTGDSELTPYTLDIPHSAALVEELDLVCVADRENSRAICYNAGVTSNRKVGEYNRTIVHRGEMGKVFSIYFNKAEKELVAAGEISTVPYVDRGELEFLPRAFTYSLDGRNLQQWAPITLSIAQDGPSLIHDLCTSKDGQEFFLGDVMQQKIFKYTKVTAPVIG
ncbi:probable peptidyl-alpha-hydroxyglycine alpha-amidating lyase pgal-1 [Aplysia californica]|uniref:peptidylamidoglycolate lyase n=1 Tax=Aplysia californica TaxID=6500 RepID=A0ABM0JIN3_APLCA|nr:probable peptidyl-alpha-hydroxyglycine alpha-amidating lyase pgal-1 [Aplysia californica]